MRLAIPADLLARAAGSAKAAGGPSDPRLLLAATPGRLAVTGADGTLQIGWDLEAQVVEPGACAINGGDLATAAAAMPKAAVLTLEAGEGKLKISAGKAGFELPVLDAEAFPGVDVSSLARDARPLEGPALARALEQAAGCTAGDEGLEAMRGVHLMLEGGRLRVAASDGFRLVIRRIQPGEIHLPPAGVVLPARAAREIARMSAGCAVVRLAATPAGLFADGSAETILARLIDASYPDLNRLLGDGGTKIGIDRARLADAAQRVARLLGRTPIAKVSTGRDGLTLDGTHENRRAHDTIPAEAPEGLVVGLDMRYLGDALKALGGQTALLAIQGPQQPVRLTSPEDPDVLCLIMPARIS
jgi:DNA polymerase-3 subunit beta